MGKKKKQIKFDVGNATVMALRDIDVEKKFWKAEDLAAILDVNIMTIYRYIKAKRLKAYKIGKEFRIDKNEFKSFLNKVKTK
ncbi:MAG: hypothetical protein A2931_02240 [Candidatus Niyogibacteria bacterium RIFCSPLOWO2_01_FULL_45_48]|uniref:Helix-turn-helix domain-containing protein n=2 Tax=Candidatus Niyogiibacteriota TaxID=1817912 RepID=A0A1G2EY75_9BACT|nr:MAG: hypothetical protein A2835_01560 [Candidatus Niyogibacteria bacterium RIFCSPHIGHO2_01_FULL_45_28]OGZ30766.1 MAG: hypothetical protein A3J00_03920 [Candidatus Niyogibacteria bacterium RIFCSPLOWO2_02_FULL_45_13]OGZ31284.1 MAG: hypothetical protein A2931_02240 [Candidatus Niyogibacteria bacterium RIFCSPLOWO2_01_FULL_45_48]